MAFKRSLALLFVLASSVLAFPHGGDDSKDGHESCSKKEFYYPPKSCCLPHGGIPSPPPPPPGKSCPPTNWYWHTEKSCCVPNHPRPENPPPPQCNDGYDWNKATQCCEEGTPTPTYPHHKPSHIPKGGDDGEDSPPSYGYPPKYEPPKEDRHKEDRPKKPEYGGKRHQKRSASALCPQAYEACPVAGLSGSEYECMDTTADLRSCGGCVSTGRGQDCTAIKGAWNVGCEVGSCAVYTCELGYKVAKDGKSCIKN